MNSPTAATQSTKKLLVRGIAWTSIFQVFQALLSFAAMLVLVRVIPPAEYGRVSVVLGFLLLINTISCGVFMRQALQLPEGVEPDWNLHWSAGFYIQLGLSGLCHAVAGVFWFLPRYRPVAVLMHIAALGIFFDWPNRFRGVMLLRQMDFRRIRIVQGAGFVLSIGTTLVLGLAGKGAYAIVIGGNLVAAMPFSLDLLLFGRWRPATGWWRMPRWSDYREALRFGVQQAASGSLLLLRGAVESAVLPGAVGLVAIGLWNRAQALFSSTVGRVQSIVIETSYPLLPRYAADAAAYRRNATLFAQVIIWMMLPGAIYLGVGGTELSRLVYGRKWIAADPLIWPGALAGLGMTLYAVGVNILLGANRLRACFVLDVLTGSVVAPLVFLVWAGAGLSTYAWALAGAQMTVGLISLTAASSRMTADWLRSVLLAPLASCAVPAVACWNLMRWSWPGPVFLRVLLHGTVFVTVLLLGLRVIFAPALAGVLDRVPGGFRLKACLFLNTVRVASAEVGSG